MLYPIGKRVWRSLPLSFARLARVPRPSCINSKVISEDEKEGDLPRFLEPNI